MQLPLSGVRVVDSTNNSGELCGRLLADLGADVILVEPPDGAALRHSGPVVDGDAELAFAWRNANKRGIVLDTTTDDGIVALDALLAEADIWLESSRAGSDEPDPALATERFPHLVICSITPFGRTGPYRDLVANDDVLEGFGATMFKAGLAPRPPLLPPTPMATDYAGVAAAAATTLALHQRITTGAGQHIDLAIMTAAAAVTDWSYPNASVVRTAGREYNEVRQGGGFMYPIFKCLDGYVRMVILAARQWQSMWEWMGEPPEFADPFWAQVGNRIGNADVLNPAYEAFFADKRMLEICAEGQNRGIVVTPLLTPAEVLTDPHFEARGTFVTDEVLPDGQSTKMASGVFEIDGTRHGFRHRAPRLNEHAGASFDDSRPAALGAAATGQAVTAPAAPLDGIRVLDFGIGGVGVEASRLLAEYGADVIKIETRTYPDFIRLVALAETSPSFVSSSRSKRSFGCNVKTPEGLALLHDLVRSADVLVENSATSTMASLGLGYDELKAINPGLVMVSSQLVGSRGPNAHWTGYGPTTQTYGGLLHVWDYDDDLPPATNSTIYPDHIAGRLSAVSAIASLIGRASSGQGGHAEIAQVEVVVNMLAEQLLAEAVAPGSAQPRGNRSPRHAPRGPFQCQGAEQWAIVSVETDDQWDALANVAGLPDGLAASEVKTAAQRLLHRDAIDARVAAWTAGRSRAEVVDQLQAVGVPCGPMLTGSDLLDDPHLVARGWDVRIDQPGVGPIDLEGPAWQASSMIGPVTFAAPGLAEHTREIAADLLGLSAAEIDDLIERGVLEDTA